MTILEAVRPIITRTYGEGEHTRALAERLAGRIAAWERADDPPEPMRSNARRSMVAEIVFDWMADDKGASVVAEQVEAALLGAGH